MGASKLKLNWSRGSGQPGLVVGNPAHSRGVETGWVLCSFSTQSILWYDSMMWKMISNTSSKGRRIHSVYSDSIKCQMRTTTKHFTEWMKLPKIGMAAPNYLGSKTIPSKDRDYLAVGLDKNHIGAKSISEDSSMKRFVMIWSANTPTSLSTKKAKKVSIWNTLPPTIFIYWALSRWVFSTATGLVISLQDMV